jgi:hypothetical protein
MILMKMDGIIQIHAGKNRKHIGLKGGDQNLKSSQANQGKKW